MFSVVARHAMVIVTVVLCVGCAGAVPPAATPASVPSSSVSTSTSRSSTTASSDPNPTTAASEGELIYSADWSSDLDGWTGNEDWTVSGGELLGRGQINDRRVGIVAPVDVEGLGGYAAEADIKLLRYEITNGSFGVMARVQEDGIGYAAGHDAADEEAVLRVEAGGSRPLLDARPFRPDDGWHRYRIEVRGNELAVLIDGAPVFAETDNTYLTGRVGLWSRGAQLAVRSFEVYGLPPG